jgi:predicted metal-dependent hydrolase
MEIKVIAPIDASIDAIHEKVRKRASWIKKQRSFFQQFHPRTTARMFISGETHLYLGRQYKLKVKYHTLEKVKLNGGDLIVQSSQPRKSDMTKALLESWYHERALIKYAERLEICRHFFPNPEEYRPSQLIIRQLKQRWGSMTPQHKLILNRTLIRASVDTIDYVITHELCHIKYKNHGSGFAKLMGKVMPDWEWRKIKLERLLS